MKDENKKYELPSEFLSDFENSFGKEFLKKYLESFNQNSEKGIHVNTLNASIDNFLNCFNENIEKIDYFDDCFYLNSDKKLGNSVLHKSGAFYLQEPSSMTSVASVRNFDFNNKLVLDLCASPGGKSLQILSLMQNTGILISNEIDAKRCFELYSNIERFGFKNSIITNESPDRLSKEFENSFDYIFVDAPCSGEGMFRKDNNAIAEWNENLKFYNQKRQLEILDEAYKMLKSDGIIVYSTCTFNTVENESVIDIFSKKYYLEILDIDEKIKSITFDGVNLNDNENLKKTRHFFPFKNRGEGQFLCVLKNNKDFENKNAKLKIENKLNSQETKIIKEFFEENLQDFNLNNYTFEKINNKINILPNYDIKLGKLKVLSKGVILGEIENQRLIPHHQFFMAYGEKFNNQINLKIDSIYLRKYLKGEQLKFSEIKGDLLEETLIKNGYGILRANNYNLGEVKIVNDDIKNHYPKALRLNKIFDC